MERKTIKTAVQIFACICMLALFLGAVIFIVSGAQILSGTLSNYSTMTGAFYITLAVIFLCAFGIFVWRFFAVGNNSAKIALVSALGTIILCCLAFLISSFVVEPEVAGILDDTLGSTSGALDGLDDTLGGLDGSLGGLDGSLGDLDGVLGDLNDSVSGAVGSSAYGATFQNYLAIFLVVALFALGSTFVNDFVFRAEYLEKAEAVLKEQREAFEKERQAKIEAKYKRIEQRLEYAKKEILYYPPREKVKMSALALPKSAYFLLSISIICFVLAVVGFGLTAWYASVPDYQNTVPRYDFSQQARISDDGNYIELTVYNSTDSTENVSVEIRYRDNEGEKTTLVETLVEPNIFSNLVIQADNAVEIESISYRLNDESAFSPLNEYDLVPVGLASGTKIFLIVGCSFLLLGLWFLWWFGIQHLKAKAKYYKRLVS